MNEQHDNSEQNFVRNAIEWVKDLYPTIFYEINKHNEIRFHCAYLKIDAAKKMQTPVYGAVEKLLEELEDSPRWSTVKRIELLMPELMESEELDFELKHRLAEVKNLLNSELHDFYLQQLNAINEQKQEADKQRQQKVMLLCKLIEDQQTYTESRQLRSQYANKARAKIGPIFAVSIIFSLLLYAIGVLYPDGIYQFINENSGEGFMQKLFSFEKKLPYYPSANIYLHYALTAVVAGWMGSCFSMLIFLKSRVENITLEELNNLFRMRYILPRIIMGMGAALICYYFFQSGLLAGSMFPQFEEKNVQSLNSSSFFTLLIWCFIAGFSENLIPNILTTTEERFAKKGR